MTCGWGRQNVQHENVAMRNPFLQQIRYKSRSFSVIYSLILRPEHLRLVLNCCFELVEVGSKMGQVGNFWNFSDKYLEAFFLVKSHVTRFICYNYSRDMSCIITNDECRKLNYVKMRNNIKSRPFFIVVWALSFG